MNDWLLMIYVFVWIIGMILSFMYGVKQGKKKYSEWYKQIRYGNIYMLVALLLFILIHYLLNEFLK